MLRRYLVRFTRLILHDEAHHLEQELQDRKLVTLEPIGGRGALMPTWVNEMIGPTLATLAVMGAAGYFMSLER